MATEIKVPTLGESVTEATVAKWMKQAGDGVAADEPLVELETDKVTLEVNAQTAGTLAEIMVAEGATVEVGAILGMIAEGAVAAPAAPAPAAATPAPTVAPAAPAPALAGPPAAAPAPAAVPPAQVQVLSPAVRRLVEEHNLNPAKIAASGKDGRLVKADVLAAIAAGTAKAGAPQAVTPTAADLPPRPDDPREERVRMSRLRQVIAKRLKDA